MFHSSSNRACVWVPAPSDRRKGRNVTADAPTAMSLKCVKVQSTQVDAEFRHRPGPPTITGRNDMFKNLNLNLLGRSQMSTVLVQDRIRRLVDSGLRGSCRPAALTSELKKRAREMDDPTLTAMERVFFGFADKTRLKILKLLAGQELCSCEVMAALGLTQPTTSHHLGIMERAGLVASRREGKWIFFRLADPKVETLLAKGTALVKRRP